MMNVVTRDIQGGIHWCMLFIGDVILVDVSRMEVDQKLKKCGDGLWRQNILALLGLKIVHKV
jgi:hypothetical protein